MFTKIKAANQCFLTAWIVLVIKKEKQNNKKQRKTKERINK